MKKRIFWGIFCILATILLIASGLGAFVTLSFWSLLGAVVLAAILIQSALHRVYAGIFIPVAIIYLIFQSPLGWPYIAPWILIIAAVVLSIGFHVMLPLKSKKMEFSHGGVHPESEISDNRDDSHPIMNVKFGNITRYLHTDNFTVGQFTCSFGGIEVYFDEAKLNADGGEAILSCSFGSIKLFVPKDWVVIDHTQNSMGGIEFRGRQVETENPPKLTLTGHSNFGGIEVVYV